MNWLTRYRRLRQLGILGMNGRNTGCILDLNPRSRFPWVDGKLRLRDLCRDMGVAVPAVYAVFASHSALRHLPRVLARYSQFVLKPNRGAAGRGILVVAGREDHWFIRQNGQRLRLADLHQHASGIISGLFSLGGQADQALVQQRVISDPCFEPVSFQGTADVRIVVYKNVPAMAMLRLPTRMSGGRANLHQGAVGAGIDLDTGTTCRAVLRNRVVESHPDTGARVVGFRVPCWSEILEIACRVSRAVGMGYVGVDIVIDRRDGPLVLEANARPGLAIQIANGQGLLKRLEAIDQQLAAQPQGTE